MTNLVYQTAVEELESVLSPRVVSRSLKEGLRQHGRSPDSVDVATLEQILKAQVYRQLQVTMPVTEAKSTVENIVGKLHEVGEDGATAEPGSALQSQAERLSTLQQSLRPFNLYFEWPEVQKLRAQLQLLESEHEAEREAPGLVSDAEAQLEVVVQKLEDQLVLQAREIGELADALEAVRSLGGPKVRRLESLVNHMRSAQESRQLAPAELERARKLARDLRKLMESSVYSETEEPPIQSEGAPEPVSAAVEGPAPAAPEDGVYDVETEDEEILAIDVQNLTPEASERLRLIDLAAETQDLAALKGDNADLLDHRPDLAERVANLEAEAAAGRSIAQDLPGLREDLAAAVTGVQQTLRAELDGLNASLGELPSGVDVSELRQAVTVALGILTTGLPAVADVEHVRQLHHLLEEQAEAQRRSEEALAAQLRGQEELVQRLEETLVRYESYSPSEDVERLRSELESLRLAQATRTLVPEVMASVRQAEERMVRELAERATEASERRRARLEAVRAQLLSFPVTQTLTDRLEAAYREIALLLEDQAGTEAASALLLDDPIPHLPQDGGLDDVEAVEALVATLKVEAADSARRRLERLGEEAAEVGSLRFAERLSQAVADLERGVFPDLPSLEADLSRASETARIEQMGELHRLSREAQNFAGLDDAKVPELTALLDSERERLNEGGHARRLGEAAILLDGIEARFEQRVASVPGRIDAALERFENVAKLNSDDVATVRRILTHLDSQRGALGRVSIGLRQQLEASLTQAETLLGSLEEEYEATRLIADQLVSEGLLDDVLGALDLGGTEARSAPGGVSPAEIVERYSDTPGVTSVVVFSTAGERLAASEGASPAGWSVVTALKDAAAGYFDASMGGPAGAGPLIVTAGGPGAHLVVAYADEVAVALIVDSPTLAPVVSGRLRRDLAGD